MPLALKNTKRIIWILVLVLAIGAFAVYASTLDKTVYVTEKLVIIPSSVASDSWGGLESVLIQDNSDYSLYQDFNKNNSAYIAGNNTEPNESAGTNSGANENINNNNSTDVNQPPGDGNQSTENVNQSEPSTSESTTTPPSSGSEESTIPVVTNESEPTPTPNVEPEPEPTEPEPTPVTPTEPEPTPTPTSAPVEPVTINSNANIYWGVFETSAENYPLAQGIDLTTTTEQLLNSNTETVATTGVETTLVEQNSNETNPIENNNTESSSTPEVSITENTSPNTDSTTATTSNTKTAETVTSDTNTEPNYGLTPCEVNSGCERHSIVFTGFDVPNFDSDVTFDTAQLRFSLAGKEKNPIPEDVQRIVVEYAYAGSDNWNLAWTSPFEGEISNSINGGYFLIALLQVDSQEKLNSLKVRLSYEGDRNNLEGIYLDSLWLELFSQKSQVPFYDLSTPFDSNFREGILTGDQLTLNDGSKINFNYSDENENESLIIKSDKATYGGLAESTVYFNVTNISDKTDNFSLQAYFPKDAGTMAEISAWNQNQPKEVTVPELRPFVYHCEGGWVKNNESGLVETTSDETPAPIIETEEPSPEILIETNSSSTETVEPSTDTTEDTVEQSSSTVAISVDDNEDTSTTVEVEATTTSEDSVDQTITETITKDKVSNSDEVVSVSAEYACKKTEVTRQCDSIEGEGTACRVNQVKVGEQKLTHYNGGWDEAKVVTESLKKEAGFLGGVKKLFGYAPTTKDVPEEFVAEKSADTAYAITPGETKYFKMKIKFPANSSGEFWIEAVGNNSLYGLLDPYWSSQWQYRMPVTLDNTNGTTDLIEQQVFLELNSSSTDFWSNVNPDGSDIRFVQETKGNIDNWYGAYNQIWYDFDWSNRVAINIPASSTASNLSDFPVYVNLANLGTDFWNKVKSDGADIRVTKKDALTEVPFELVAIDTGADTGELYFKADALSSTTASTFYIYYGNSGATAYSATSTYGRENVWTNNYQAVYHMTEANAVDSTSNHYNGTGYNIASTTGKLGKAGNFTGATNSYIQIPAGTLNGLNDITTSYWAKSTTTRNKAVVSGNVGANNNYLIFPYDTYVAFFFNNTSVNYTTSNIADGVYHQATFVSSASADTVSVYHDGSLADSGTQTIGTASINAVVLGQEQDSEGGGFNSAQSYQGDLDEVRIASAIRSASWVAAEYNNINSPTSFYSVASSEASPFEIDYGSWNYRLPITIDNAKVPSDVTDFPVYVDLSDLGNNFFANVKSTGADIRITTADGKTEVPYDLVAIDTGAKTGELHFKAPTLLSSNDTVFYIYFGNDSATSYSANATYGSEKVWTNNYTAVYHMGNTTDATGKGHGGTGQNGITIGGASGKLGSGTTFDGTNDYISVADHNDFTFGTGSDDSSSTISVWTYYQSAGGSGSAALVSKYEEYSPTFKGEWSTSYSGSTNKVFYQILDGATTDRIYRSSDSAVTKNQWNYTVFTSDGIHNDSSLKIYNNGSLMSSTGLGQDGAYSGTKNRTSEVSIGASLYKGSLTYSGFFGGRMDEVRIASTSRSADWITAEYNNQSDTKTFYATSTVEMETATTHSELDFWLQHFSTSTDEADIWVQVDRIPAGASTTIYLYYGNSGATSVSNEYAPFTYSTSTPIYYVVNNDATASTTIYSLIDNNEIRIDGGSPTTLNSGESMTMAGYSANTVISVLGPITSKQEGTGPTEPVIPISFATTTFVIPSDRYTANDFHVYAPFATATVNIYDRTTLEDSGTVNTGSSTKFTGVDIANNNSGVVVSNQPVLVFYNAMNGATPYDGIVAYPPTLRDLYGHRSNAYYYGTPVSGSNINIYCSSGVSGTDTAVTGGVSRTGGTCANGADGTGDAVRLTGQTTPFAAIRQGDSDGGDSSSFLPGLEFGTRYIMPVDSNYVAVACAPRYGTTTLEIQDSTGNTVETGTCAPSGQYPGTKVFNNGGSGDTLAYAAGYQIVSTNGVPFFTYYEGNTNSDEMNTWSAVQAKKFIAKPITASYGAQELAKAPKYEQLSFRWYENTNALTPTTGWSLGDDGPADEGEVITTAGGGVNVDDVLRLRMNLKANSATGTINSASFRLQYAESSSCSINDSWVDIGKQGSTTAHFSGYNNASVADGELLPSRVLASSTVSATYEEDSPSNYLVKQIDVNAVAEWDWVIEATNPKVNSSYCFRMVDASNEPVATYTNYPRLETAGPPLSPTLLSYFDNEKSTSTTPVFEFVTTDSSGDDIHYQVQVDDNNDFSSPNIDRSSISHFTQFENIILSSDKAPMDNGAPVRFTPGVTLSNNTTYWWRVRGLDPTGSNSWGDWSTANSFTIDTAGTISQWYQTTDEQFATNALVGVAVSGSDSVVGSSSGTMTSDAIDFDDGTIGNAWGQLSWHDTETSGTITYQVQYKFGSSWLAIPDSEIPGNSSGNSTSPVSLVGLSTDTYNQIRVVATFAGSTLSLEDWTVSWGQRVSTPVLPTPFDNEKVATTTPLFTFTSTDPQSDDLEYEVSWGLDKDFISSTTRNSSSSVDFVNVNNGGDTNPFTSGHIISYRVPTADSLTNGSTYWWRVRAKDPAGNNAWSPWSKPNALTVDTAVSVSTWFQTTKEQFEEGVLTGLYASTSNSVLMNDQVGEFGKVTVTNGTWTEVSTQIAYNNPIVTASVRYDNTTDPARTVRIRNKTADSFEILVDNYNSSLTGSTVVDYVAMEAGDWSLEDGGTGHRVVAGSTEVSEVQGGTISGLSPTAITFSPAFSAQPMVLSTVSTENDSSWVYSNTNDGSTNRVNEPSTTGLGLYLARGSESAVHDPEYVDYIAFEPGHGTNNGSEFDFKITPNSVRDEYYTMAFSSAFSSTPQVAVVQLAAQNNAQLAHAFSYTGVPTTASNHTVAVDEGGATADRNHGNEQVSVVAFENSTGILKRQNSGSLTGSVYSEPIKFSDGAGPKFERFLWGDSEPGSSSITYQVEYQVNETTWALIPNASLSGNSTGFSSSPVSLTGIDTGVYQTIRLKGNFTCVSGNCPSLNDWTVEWSEGVAMSGTLKAYDRSTNVATGTVKVAVNGTLLPGSGTVSGGTWSINNVTAFTGDTVTVFVDGASEANEAVSVFVYDGVGDMTGVQLYEQHLSLSADENATTTNALLSEYDYSVSGDEDIFFEVDASNDLSVCTQGDCGQANLYIGSGNVYIPDSTSSGNVKTFDLINDGYLKLDGNTMRVGGSWKNNSVFIHDTSSVIFTATSTSIISGVWYDPSWSNRTAITIQSSKVVEDLSNFPVYVDLANLGSSFFSNVQSDGDDIRVTASDGVTELAREVVGINISSSTGELYFKANSISSSTNTTFYIYHGSSTASGYTASSTYGRNNVWTNNFTGVYHLEEDQAGNGNAGLYIDSTASSSHADDEINATGKGGKLGRGQEILGRDNNTDDYIDIPRAVINGQTNFTSSFWFKTNNTGNQGLLSGGPNNEYLVYLQNNVLSFFAGGSSVSFSITAPTDNAWHKMTVVRNDTSNQVRLYIDGVPDNENPKTLSMSALVIPADCFVVGQEQDGCHTFDGTQAYAGFMDELRFEKAIPTDGRVKTVYNNESSPTTFYSASTTELVGDVINKYANLDDSDGTLNFYNVTFGEISGNATWVLNKTLDVDRDLAVSFGKLSRGTKAITVARNLATGASGFWSGLGTTTFDGNTAGAWTDSNTTKQNIGRAVVDGTLKTVNVGSSVLAENITIAGDDTLSVGGAYTISLLGNFTNNNVFTPNTSTITIVGSATNAVIHSGSSSLYNLTASSTGGTVAFDQSTLTLLGSLTIATGTVTLPSATTTIGRSFLNTGGTFVHNNGTVIMNAGVAGQSVTQNGTTFLNAFNNLHFTGSGAWSFTDSNATTSGNLIISAGSVTFPTGSLTVGKDFTVSGGGSFNHNNGEVIFLVNDYNTTKANGSAFNNVRVSSIGASSWYGGAWEKRLPLIVDNAMVSSTISNFPVYVDLSHLGVNFFSEVQSSGADIRITASDGITEVPYELVAINTGSKTGELYFKAPTLATSTDTNFYIYFDNPTAIAYSATSTYGSRNVWTNDYIAVYHLSSANDSTANQHNGTGQGGITIGGTTGKLGGATNFDASNDYIAIPDSNDLTMGYSGVDHSFTVSAWTYYQSAGGNANNAVIVGKYESYSPFLGEWNMSYNGTTNTIGAQILDSATNDRIRQTTNSGVTKNQWNYTVFNSDGLEVDSSITLYNNNSLMATTPGGDVGYAGTQNRAGELSIGAALHKGLLNFSGYFGGKLDEIRISSSSRSTGWLTTEYNNQSNPTTFYATSSVEQADARAFTDTNATILGNLMVDSGNATLPSGTLTIGGSLSNTAAFDANNGTILFNSASGTKTINPGISSFNNLTFNSSAGNWTVTGNATTTGAVTLTSANNFTLQSGKTLAVLGTAFTNNMAANTTWSSSTLLFKGGNDLTLNSKSSTGDIYGNLVVADDSDITMWNSSADTYQTLDIGSIYSPDHASVDGDLYIFGNYARTTGTEYWNYANDFDGTALGSSSRQANVRIASSSVITLTNASLNLTGISSASTTINSQSGAFSLVATNTTMTAKYFSVAGTDVNGLQLLSSTTIVSLEDGAFSVAPGRTGITIDGSTVNNNALDQYLRINFATTSVGSANNVTLSGSAGTFVWFKTGSGNLYGEAFDAGDADPGNIRFDDSSYNISISGVVYQDDGVTTMGTPTCDGSTKNVRVVIDGGAFATTTSCNASTGAYSFPSVAYIGDPSVVVYLNTDGGAVGSVITKTPTNNITGLDIYANRVITRHENILPLSIADMTDYDFTDDTDLKFTAGTSTLTLEPNTELFVFASSTFTPTGNIILTGNGNANSYEGTLQLGVGSTFNASSSETHTLAGRLVVRAGANLNTASSTFVFNATTTGKSITSGATLSFYDLVFNGAGGGWNITAPLSVRGDVSIDAGTVTGTSDITILNGSIAGNGILSLGSSTLAINNTNTFGGSSAWTVNNLTLGNGSIVGTTTLASSATTTVLGTLTISNAHFLDVGNSHWDLAGAGTVLIETGTLLEGTSLFRYSGANANLTSTTYYDLLLDAGAGSATYTGVGSGVNITNNLTIGGTASTTANFNTNDPAVTVGGNILINSGSTLALSNQATTTVLGNYDNNGVLDANNGLINFTGSGSQTISAGNSNFGNVNINGSGNFTMTENATSSGSFKLINHNNFTQGSSTTLAVVGKFTNGLGATSTTWTGSTLALVGTDAQIINASTTSDTYDTLLVGAGAEVRMWNSDANTLAVTGGLYSMDHNGTNGLLQIYGNFTADDYIDYWSYATDFDGTDLSGGAERAVTVAFASGTNATWAGDTLYVIGTSSASTTLQNQGTGTYTLTLGGTLDTTWNYVVLRDLVPGGLVFSGAPVVNNFSNTDMLVTTNNGSAITIGGSVINANEAKNFTNNLFAYAGGVTGAINVTATGTSVSSWRFTNHTGNLAGETQDSDPAGDPGYLVWDDSAALITVSGNVYSDEGTTVSGVCDGVTNNIVLRVAGLTTYSTSCNASTGAYSISNVAFGPLDTLTLYIDGETTKAANVTKAPVSSISNLHLYANRVIVRHENTNPLSIADMAVWDSSDDADIPFTAVDGGTDTLTLPADRKLIIWNNKTFAPNGNVTISGGGGGASYDGTLEAYAGAKFTGAGSEAHSVGGSLVFGSGATLTAASSTFTFTTTGTGRTIDVNSAPFANVAFTGSGSWTITDSTFTTDNNLSQSAGTVTYGNGTTTVGGAMNVTGGSFVMSTGPLLFTASSLSNTVRFNNSNVPALKFTGTGSWNMTDTNATSTGSFTVASGTVSLPSGTLTLSGSFENLAGTITHNTAEIVIATSSATTLRANGSDLFAVTVKGGTSLLLADSNLTLRDNLTLASGTINLSFTTSTIAIGGSLDLTGGVMNSASSTILFNASATGKNVNTGSNQLFNVIFGSGTGGWTWLGNATTTNNLSINSASSFTKQSGTTLVVGGVFTNIVGGSATTWTGSNLVLASGLAYTINTKTTGSDVYDTLTIGNNTAIRLWNSSASSTLVSGNASLYSQDHANTNGLLRIYGNLVLATSTEYWSHATDFDGTALTGGDVRPVTVEFVANATSTLQSGSLIIGGAVGATTTIQSVSGTYAFNVTGGTLNASYYRFNDLNIDGLNFSGTPAITSLSNGYFNMELNGSSLITLASTTLNANASKIFSKVGFEAGVLSGYNVKLVGDTTNAWRFEDGYGSLEGEDYDYDGLDDCGSIRFDDSSCLLTEQTHVRWRNDDGGEGAPTSEWFDTNWDYRQRVRIVNNDASTYASTAIKVALTYDSGMNSDFSDLRFTSSDGQTQIPYWIERYTASTDAVAWVRVPSLPANSISTVFVYYGNSSATTTTGNGTNTFDVFDDFEDNDITEYSGDSSLFTVDTTPVYGGGYALEAANKSGRTTDGIYRTDLTTEQGQIIRFMQYLDTGTGSGDEACTLFGVQSPGSANNNYAICLEQFGTDRLVISRNVTDNDVSGTIIASSTATFSTGWYEVEVVWKTDDTISAYLYNSSNNLVASTTVTDSNYTSGGLGFTFWFQNGSWDSYTARDLGPLRPTIYLGARQSSGGASWVSAQDASGSSIPGQSKRLRLAIENSGLDITNQTFRLEYAAKASAPSCEAVSSGSYVTVPNQATCGSSPVCMQTSTQVADGDLTTDLLNDTSGTFSSGRVVESPSSMTGSLNVNQKYYTELEYVITPTANAVDAYCFRVTNAGTPLDYYSKIAELSLQFDPVFGPVTLNGGNDITLTPGATTTVYATGTVTDYNGYTDIVAGTSTIYRSGAGASCSANNNNCYISNTASACSFTNCAGNTCELTCKADIYFHADATDQTPYEGEEWLAYLEASDNGGGYDFASALGVELLTIRALTVDNMINYGALAVGDNTGAYNASTTVTNLGNTAFDLEIQGTDLSDGNSSVIPAEEQIFATSTFNYSACLSCAVVSSSAPVPFDLALTKPTTDMPPVSVPIYWGIAVPLGVNSAPHQGINSFTPVSP